jgi:glutaconyl-CoA/methylmalonyl-CoA decarboxylase subunit gamma
MKYIVTVNGKKYEVEVERADAAKQESPKENTAETNNPPKTAVPADGAAVVSPMPGTIVEIKAAVGQQVKKGQTLMVLEAMKMENEILADHDAVVESISISKGASVNTGDVLMTLK